MSNDATEASQASPLWAGPLAAGVRETFMLRNCLDPANLCCVC